MPEGETSRISVRIEPWGPEDLWLEKKLMGDPAMTVWRRVTPSFWNFPSPARAECSRS
jgi:hypothetical protein